MDHEIVRPGKELTFSFLFSATSSTADKVIVDLLANARPSSAVTVVTKDHPRPCGLGTGATVMGPEEFLSWADTSDGEEGARAARARSGEEDEFGTDLDSLLL